MLNGVMCHSKVFVQRCCLVYMVYVTVYVMGRGTRKNLCLGVWKRKVHPRKKYNIEGQNAYVICSGRNT